MSGAEITSSNDDASFAKANRKQILLDSGTNIEAATKQGHGQQAICTSASSGKVKGTHYETFGTTLWQHKLSAFLWGAKFGLLTPCSATFAENLDGMYQTAVSVGSVSIPAISATTGRALDFTSGSSIGNQASVNVDTLWTMRNHNPTFKVRWKLDESGTNIRFFAGFHSSTAQVGNTDDMINAASGFAVALNTGTSNYRIVHNDGAGATVSDDTGVAANTNFNTIEIWGNENASGFYWSLNDNTPTLVTTEIPASTTALGCQITATAVNADAKVMSIIRAVITCDK